MSARIWFDPDATSRQRRGGWRTTRGLRTGWLVSLPMPRLFLGIPVPASSGLVAAADALAVVDLEASAMRLAPVPDHQWHLTWAFLGFVPDEQVGELREAVSSCVARLRQDGLDATLRVSGVGCFGGPIWAGIEFRILLRPLLFAHDRFHDFPPLGLNPFAFRHSADGDKFDQANPL